MKLIHHVILAIVLLTGIALAEASSIDHKGRSDESPVQEYVSYAWDISNGDLDFVATLEAENGRRDPKRQSNVVTNGIREDSRGFCQLHRKRHKSIVDDPRFLTDWKRQMEQCYKKYKGGTKFYGYHKRNQLKNRFTITQGHSGTVEYKEISIPEQKGCRYLGKAKGGEKLQIDRHGVKGFIRVLFEWFVPQDEEALVFVCDN